MRDGTLETWRTDLETATEVAADERSLTVLANPAISTDRRAEVLDELLGGRTSRPSSTSSNCCSGAVVSRSCRGSPRSSVASTMRVRASPTPP